MADNLRLDVALTQRGMAASRQRAARMIKAGEVTVNGKVIDKPAHLCMSTDVIEATETLTYVGRGGLKLESALDVFSVDPVGMRCLDVGASTGGFTDCLLRRGARHVYAVDVGTGHLDRTLVVDDRVTSLERTDIRLVSPEALGGPVELAVCDVSFISLTLVLPALHSLTGPEGQVIALIKPQFEAGRPYVGKRGIVRDPKAHLVALDKVTGAAKAVGFTVSGLTESPVLGGDGNREFLIWLTKGGQDRMPRLEDVVARAHSGGKHGKA